ncbi:deoxynucleoside kinase [Anaerocolumna xylanovorans]|uniref:Thymidylate kinase n=1 Tax=Anaerocolumna xylanovorans DSM 12503 TaxID=1121345 RepID=A0A1M7XWU7_9FIRM|nr:deoxynucleoside kinase [Anaerocolumna xylanovorans]SHO43129.1 Thymidylate kinase [Anaerocolumna xylanovorans DSM 12503]
MKPIFVAGPHGSGKTTLISNLIEDSDKFIKDDFQIDFSNEMESLPTMTIFEKCLIRLYHRFYTAQLAIKKCKNSEDDKILIIDRSIYDSLVYIEVEYSLGELTKEQYTKLKEIVDNGLEMIKPYTIILNPDPNEVVNRLNKRRLMGTRKKRDELCAREDNVDYVGMMNDQFIKIYTNENVIPIKNNESGELETIYKWIDEKVLS